MRIITGTVRGRKLKAPANDSLDIRPTSDSVKEAVFSAVQFEIEGKVVADLFAGTGQLGIEALSRGASRAYFCDNSSESVKIIRENLRICDFSAKSEVSALSAAAFLKKTAACFDVAFLDPPYGMDLINRTVPVLIPKMNKGGIIICEYEKGYKIHGTFGDFNIRKTYSHGKTAITIYDTETE